MEEIQPDDAAAIQVCLLSSQFQNSKNDFDPPHGS
jgi:hypothetical protein